MNTVPVTALIRRELFDRAGGYRAAMRDGYEDWDFWLSCAEQGAQTAHVPAPLFLHRAETGSLIAHAQQRDAELKARLVHQHPGLFTQVQTQWAHTLLGILRMKGTAPPLQGQSFSRVGELPNDAEAYADLGSVAIWDGDIAGGVLKWAEACCSPMPSYLLYAQLTHAVNQLGLTGSFAKAMERVHPVSRQE